MQDQTDTAEPTAPETNGADTPVDEEAEGREFFVQMEALLDRLVPPDEVVLTTCTGKTITLPGAIAARQQVKVFRLMRDLVDDEEVKILLASISTTGGTGMGMVDAILTIATNDHIANKLGEIFTAAYPDVLAGEDPLDVLPMEELISAIVPFSERFIKKLGTGITALGRSATEMQATS